MTYSKEQSSAIMHTKGPMMVMAGPGSGKTTVITRRIKYLIESAGVSPAEILVITFTKAAAFEMEQRFKEITRGSDYPVRFGTFHSIFFWIIKRAYNLNNSSVISETEKRAMMDKLMKSMSVDYDNKEDIITSTLAQISIVKCDMIDIENYYSKNMPENDFRQLYLSFEKEMKRQGKIDFDDMMVMCYELLAGRADILEQLRKIFKYILVDEFQDSNRIQYEIFKLLAKPKENVFVVGDDDQSVYGFRGARPEIMQTFVKDFDKCKIVKLGENYRCGKAITEASIKVISENKNRFSKKLFSNRGNGIVKIIKPRDIREESLLVVKSIKEHFEAGIPLEKQAVLYRTNMQPRPLVYRLNEFNVPFTMSDIIPNIFEHFVVKNVLDYMRIAMGDNKRATFLRVMNKPSRYISRDMLVEEDIDLDTLIFRARAKEYLQENLIKLQADIKLIRKMRPYPTLNFIRKSMGYDDYLKEYARVRQMDYVELEDILDEFSSMIVDMTSYGELFEFIEDYDKVLRLQQENNKSRKGVNLMTMHSAKGLEFDVVHIIDAVEGVTPHKKAKTFAELEEERRMFYVAMTRAINELYIYAPKEVLGKKKEVSPYLKLL